MVTYRYCSLSYCNTAARVCRDSMNTCRIWNRRVQEGHTKHCAVFQQPTITNNRESKRLAHMALMDRTAPSRAFSQEIGSYARQQVPWGTVRLRLQQQRLSARWPCLRLWRYIIDRKMPFMVCSTTNLDAGMVWCHVFRRISILFTASWWSHPFLAQSCTTYVASVHSTWANRPITVCGAIEYSFWSPLLRINGTLNSGPYISFILRSVALPFIQALRNAIFQQENSRLHVTVLFGPSLIQKMFRCCPALHVL